MQGALPNRPQAELESFCQCTEDEARAAGASEGELLNDLLDLERDPKALAPSKTQAAARACFEQAVSRVDAEADEEFQRTAEARNAGDARVTYRWKAWIRAGGGMQQLEPPEDTWPIEIAGVACELGPVLREEHLDGEIWQRDVMRTFDCPGAQVKMMGTRFRPSYTGCSYSRDGKTGIEGGANFDVRLREGEEPVGTLMLSCERTDR
jgi:hypothetical protein